MYFVYISKAIYLLVFSNYEYKNVSLDFALGNNKKIKKKMLKRERVNCLQ